MFGKLFGKKDKDKEAPEKPAAPVGAATSEPERGTSEKLLQLLTTGAADANGRVHVETVLAALGALAGFGTQMGVREKFVATGKKKEADLFKAVTAKNGDVYYLGDVFFDPLWRVSEGHTSVFKMVAEAAQKVGATQFPSSEGLGKLISHVLASLGSPDFGVPRLPQKNMPLHLPFDLLRDCWDTTETVLKLGDKGDPLRWPFMIGETLQLLVLQSKGVIDPNLVLPIVMECMTPMSHVNPALVVGQTGKGGKLTIDMGRTEAGKLLQADVFKTALADTRKKEYGEK